MKTAYLTVVPCGDKAVHPNLARALIWLRGYGGHTIKSPNSGDVPICEAVAEADLAGGSRCCRVALGSVGVGEIERIDSPSLEDCEDLSVRGRLEVFQPRPLTELARRAGLTPNKAKRALQRLTVRGVAERVKVGRGTSAWSLAPEANGDW